MRVLMCEPTKYDVVYEINPWMHVGEKPNKKLAHTQWRHLHDTYKKLGVEVELIAQGNNLPDMVFTANAGVVLGKTFIRSNFKHMERKGEEKYFHSWFERKGFTVKTLPRPQGGEGDALFYRKKLYMGHGFRSYPEMHHVVEKIHNVPIVSLELIDPYFYDFDTAFCPIGELGFLYYPDAFPEKSRKKLEKTDGAIPITKKQAENFVCNSVYVDDKMLVGYLDKDLKKKLSNLKVDPIEMDMSEFKKGGGGIKCLTLYIDRN